jgi:predicted lysophospholipase L1 biosynthesis ABC-type transport system permease subunit
MRDATRQVVGIVGDVRDADGRDAEPTIYVPLLQADDQLLARQHALTSMRWIVRTAADPELMAAPVTALLERAAPGAAVVQTRSMTAILSEQIARARLALQLLSAFAAMALLLALVGLYGFVANAVRQRTQELGIRLALGASGARLLRLVVRESGEIVAGGIIVGVLASMLLGTGIETVVFGTRPLPMIYLLGAAVALLCAALTAAVVAAVPVMRLDPRTVIDR